MALLANNFSLSRGGTSGLGWQVRCGADEACCGWDSRAPSSAPRLTPPWRAFFQLLLAFTLNLTAFGAAPVATPPAAPVQPDFEVKAEYLFVFTKYVEWPAAALTKPDQSIVLGVLGDDAIGDALELKARGRLSQGGRKVTVLRARRAADLVGCHMVFVGQGERRNVREITEVLRDQPVLTVCDTEGLFTQGLMIKFVLINERVKFEVKLEPVQRVGLSIQSGMLGSASRVWRKASSSLEAP
ncbi:MAG: hypothetical protein RL514_17 [Verrucomicrobiota bacterium]|jgi:hypothetical protein